MLLQVHDELLFEVPLEEVEKLKSVILDAMQDKLHAPVLVETGTGKNWLEAH